MSSEVVQIVFVEVAVGRLAADDAANEAAELDCMYRECEVQAEPAHALTCVVSPARNTRPL